MSKRKTESLTTSRFGKRFCETRLESSHPDDFLIWRIARFSLFEKEDFRYLHSPKFKAAGCSTYWKISLYSKSSSASDDIQAYISGSPTSKFNYGITLSISTASDETTNIHSFKYGHKKVHRIPSFLKWSRLLEQKDSLLHGDALTIHFRLDSIKESVRIGFSTIARSSVDHGPLQLTKDFGGIIEDKTFADVVLKLGDIEIPAHKAILACRSPIFAAMFNTDMVESKSEEVVISDIDLEVFKEFLRFLYTQQVSFRSVDFILKLLLAADKYDVQSLKTMCTTRLFHEVTQDNVLDVLFVADACSEKELTEECLEILRSDPPLLQSLVSWLQMCNECPRIPVVLERLLKEQQSNPA